MRVLVALALCVPLGGCFSLTGPKALPEWAMNPQVQVQEASTRPRRAVAQRQPREVQTRLRWLIAPGPSAFRPTCARPVLRKTAPRRRPSAAQPREVTAFSAEWKAREDAADEKLRRSMNICRGC